MKNYLVILALSLLMSLSSVGQLCPGGGSNFSAAIMFDPAWIYGCNTGTSCNGGVAFDNRAACLPILSLDICAPGPSVGNILNSASNVWFKFYASAPTAVVSCFQNTSLVLGIQAFTGGPACGALTEIGCALSGGPSSGVQLYLSSLIPGKLYYFRIFGSANPISQRTGLYCFCGSTGLGNFLILSARINGFSGEASMNKINLRWTTTSGNANQYFELERSSNGSLYTRIAAIPEQQTGELKTYTITDEKPLEGLNYYRIKERYPDDHYEYTATILVKKEQTPGFSISGNIAGASLPLLVKNPVNLTLSDISGHILQRISFAPGKHSIPTGQLAKGVYLLQSLNGEKAQKFYVLR
ncbi:MAG: hypothetical protein ABIQ88_03420 [Chitinophagaceae bacterium]